MRVFIDTNLWAYRLDGREPEKQARMQRWLPEVVGRDDVVTTDTAMILDAHELAAREQLSWFDALIAEAAIRSHCSVLFSEDFGHERMLDGVKVLNPWRL
jgi:Predicted nucleic-acid-binding protein, contains PIN domain